MSGSIPIQLPEALQVLGQDVQQRALNHELLTALRGLLDALEEGRAWSGDPRYIAAQRAVAAAEGVAS